MSLVHIYSGSELKNLAGAVTAETVKDLWGTFESSGEVRLDFGNHVFYILVCSSEGALAGLARVIYLETKDKKYAVLHNVFVTEASRGQGLGTALIQAVIHFGKEKDLNYLELTSNPERSVANALYQKSGFTLVAAATPDGTNLYRYYFQ